MSIFKCNKEGKDYFLPVSILIAALLIGGSVIYSAGKKAEPTKVAENPAVNQEAQVPSFSYDKIRAVTEDDFIKGDINAPVKIVLYSDTECPFCKRFHTTMQEIMTKYGNKVAWVYRFMPLDGLHQYARKEAEALACAGDLGGDAKMFAFMDRIMELTTSNDGLEPTELPKIATYVGLDKTKFTSCLDSGKFADLVEKDVQEAQSAGIQGTPFSVVLGPNGAKDQVAGAYPTSEVSKIIDAMLK